MQSMMPLEDNAKEFLCNTCGKRHSLYLQIEMPEPDILFSMSDEEKSVRVFIRNHLSIIDESIIYSKARLSIRIEGENESIDWELWVRLTGIDEFIKETAKLRDESPVFVCGILEIGIPLYEELENFPVDLIYDKLELDLPPKVRIQNNDSLISQEFRKGIDKKRLETWTKRIYHPKWEG